MLYQYELMAISELLSTGTLINEAYTALHDFERELVFF
ncbi:hypothetical protein GAGA_4394 [Paraglaciecola agarilytica NO2]|uniref:Uncharacterized protein n=1 Tax=Paraglaciecola agarilytica NO2 TaxID=1125747 RepID=A0ABQ0ICX6_9ALTE|nr:hypothetical protein GAGA_4394 [Paraglaciecola agarilytica NO2]